MKRPTRQAQFSSQAGMFSLRDDNSPDTDPKRGTPAQLPADTTDDHHRTLILTLEGNVIREYPIANHNLAIGRRHGNDIQLNDMTLSGRHALISIVQDNVFIEDLDSTNGTLLNGCHIKKVVLEHGDIIQIGHHQLTYLCEQDTPYTPTMFVKAEHDETQFIYSGDIDEENLSKGNSLGVLKTVNKRQSPAGPVMELRKTYNTIGFRGKRMALISRGSSGYSITAITGSHSRRASDVPLLNGEQLDDSQQLLQPGDLITIAGYDLLFYLLD